MPDSSTTSTTGTSGAFKATAIVAGVVAIGAAMWVWQPWAGDAEAGATASASPTPSVTAASSIPTPSVTAGLVAGFAPVEQLPLASVPWEQVGPGWFLIDAYESVDEVIPGEFDFAPSPQLSGGVSLVSPEGDWYAVRTHDELGAGPVIAWDGNAGWIAREGVTTFESLAVRLALVDLRAGEQTSEGSGAVVDGALRYGYSVIDDGAAIALAYGGDGMVQAVVGPEATGGACLDAGGYVGTALPDDVSGFYSPELDAVVCLVPEGSGTSVRLVTVAEGGAGEEIATLSGEAFGYEFAGWVDSDRFLLFRNGVASDPTNAPAPALFLGSISAGTYSELDLDFYSAAMDATGTLRVTPAFFDRQSQRHVVERHDGDSWSVDLYDVDGSTEGSIAGTCAPQHEWPDASTVVTVSGDRLLVSCLTTGHVTMADAADGSVLGEWDLGAGWTATAFDYPEQ